MSLIEANLQGVNAQISAAIKGREAAKKAIFLPGVTLIAVSKTKPLADIMEAYAVGQRHFGENYVQEAVEKIVAARAVRSEPSVGVNGPIQWHLIGPLQSNKAKLAALHFDWVHTLDRLKIAEALNTHRAVNLPKLNVLIQVNISAEVTKHGVAAEQLKGLIAAVAALPMLNCRGLMAIIEDTQDSGKLGAQFKQMWEIFSDFKAKYTHFDTLSMGMSQDFQQAIDEGATMIRVGSAIFGARDINGATNASI